MSVKLHVEGAVATILFDRPEARNAITFEMYEDLARICGTMPAGVRVVLVKGAGGSFAAGTDISRFTSFAKREDAIAYEELFEKAVQALENLEQPTIAVVEGAAVGGGAALLCACDLRLSAPDARFGVPIARTVGNALSVRNTARLVASVGPAVAKMLLFSGELATAQQALAAGLINEIHEHAQLHARAAELAARIAQNAPLTIQAAKKAVRAITAPPPEDVETLVTAYLSADFKEGVAAFLEKRKPKFSGR